VNAARTLLALCFFQANPQDLPYAPRLVWMSAAAALLTQLRPQQQLALAATAGGVQLAVLGLFLHTLLTLQGKPERWTQSATALFGAIGVTNLASWPVLWWLEQNGPTPAAALPLFVGLAIGVWFLAILAHILRQALEVGSGPAILLGLGGVLLALFVTVFLASAFHG